MKYSIITINYNNKEGLRKTIESVIHQTYRDFEYIVIDGGSTDGSADVLKEFNKQITYWVSEPDKGIYNAMNKGIMQAHGEYLNFMNSGDCFYDKNVLRDILPDLDSDIVTGKIYYEGGPHGFWKENVTMLDFFKGSLEHQASFIRKELFVNRLYDESFKIIADWKFFVDTLIYENASFHNLDTIVCLFDTSGISRTSSRLIHVEGARVFDELFPKRIQEDYFRWKRIDSPLSDLVAELNGTVGILKITKHFIMLMIKLKKLKASIFKSKKYN